MQFAHQENICHKVHLLRNQMILKIYCCYDVKENQKIRTLVLKYEYLPINELKTGSGNLSWYKSHKFYREHCKVGRHVL